MLKDTVYFEDEEIQNEQSLRDAFEDIHRLKVENDELQKQLNILQAVTTSKLQLVEKELALKTLMLKELTANLRIPKNLCGKSLHSKTA